MQDDIAGGLPPRKKPKIIHPLDQPDKPSIHQLAAREGHDLSSTDEASGPEAGAAMVFVHNKKYHAGQAANVDTISDQAGGTAYQADPPKVKSDTWHRRLTKRLSRKQWMIPIAFLAIIVIAGGVVFAMNWPSKAAPIKVNAAAPVKPKPTPIYSPLTGLPVTAAQTQLPVTGVMIENSVPARPQSGLSQAGVVYEAIAEAGITRFLALYQESEPSSLGPVRSARPYFVAWDDGYGAPYAHVGGSPEALADIRSWQVKDLDEFYAGGYYHRISSRYAPHNMYTSMAKLQALEKSRGWYQPANFVGFARQDGQPVKQLSAATINMDPSSSDYAVAYVYDQQSNVYKRSEGGAPMIDAATRQQIAPNVVVALIIPYSLEADHYHSDYQNVGTGPAYVFQNGGVTKCTWSKASDSAPLKLLDANGQDVKLNRGQTWLTALANTGDLSYKP